jgi:hypothetical protein
LEILYFRAEFFSLACCVLHRIAFPVVSEWCQKKVLMSRALYEGAVAPAGGIMGSCSHPQRAPPWTPRISSTAISGPC